ncbi:MAG: DUF1501 domain-containing protein [Pirellulaceae bacterium]|jgi:hypothetical protein|nr:DUF1501 domain-containing protein [Pirellulaceae bacterium]
MNKSSPGNLNRREWIRAGSLGLLGISMADVAQWQQQATAADAVPRARNVIYIFLTGGPSQHDTFDMKPDGPADYKGEFNPIATNTPGLQICEHLPGLAQRSHLWGLVRSLTHKESGHDKGTYVMLTGQSTVPPSFRSSQPQSTDLPSIAAISGVATRPRGNMPTSVILPEKIYHSNTGVYPGQFAGLLGSQHEPWLVECTDKPHAYHDYSGAFPKYLFNLHDGVASDRDDWKFEVPHLKLQEGILENRFRGRLDLLDTIDVQRKNLERVSNVANYNRLRQSAVSLMTDPKVREAFNVRKANPRTLERYGDNSFGWSLLMARRLVAAGVNMVQVNLGNFGSWDLHGNNFPLLKNFLLPPTDQAVSALLDDLHESGLLENTLVVMAGEFGRSPRIFNGAPNVYKLPGRDHWAPCQSVLFAGAGIQGGTVIGSSDRNGAYPASDPQTPENFAATIYQALGIPRDANWYDLTNRPYHIYQADPIPNLLG